MKYKRQSELLLLFFLIKVSQWLDMRNLLLEAVNKYKDGFTIKAI